MKGSEKLLCLLLLAFEIYAVKKLSNDPNMIIAVAGLSALLRVIVFIDDEGDNIFKTPHALWAWTTWFYYPVMLILLIKKLADKYFSD